MSIFHYPTSGFRHPMRDVRKSSLGDGIIEALTGKPKVSTAPVNDSTSLLAWMTGDSAAAAEIMNDPSYQVSSAGTTAITIADFATIGGVCKPRNFVALNYAKELQRQMNRVAQVKGFSKVSVDGAIGSGTTALLAKIKSVSPLVMGTTTSCVGVAADADVIGDQVREAANGMGAPATVSGPTLGSSASQIVTKGGKVATVPGTGDGVMGAFTAMGSTEKVVMLGLVGGIGYVLMKGKKRGGGSRKTRR